LSGRANIDRSGQPDGIIPPAGRPLPRRIERRIWIARALLTWERLWAGLWTSALLFGLFIASALFGVFDDLALGIHWALLAAFALFVATALWTGLKSFRLPSRDAALAHLEAASGLNHQPLSAYEDVAAQGTGDAVLWRAHQDWVAQRLKKLKLGFVAPGLVMRDPYGLRAIVVLLLVIGVAGTGPGRLTRIAEAFFPGASNARAFSIEAWITPPAYTGLQPIYLERSDLTPTGSETRPAPSDEAIKVPVGSVLSLRAHGLRSVPSLEIANDEDRGRPEPLDDLGSSNYTVDAPLTNSAELSLTLGGRLLRAWAIETIPDAKPRISLTMPLQQTASGSMHFAYQVTDDYGVKSAYARITLADASLNPAPDEDNHAGKDDSMSAEKPDTDSATAMARRTLANIFRQSQATATVTPPVVTLPLKSLRPKEGKGDTYVDLTPHPWAGLPVLITLVAVDDAGQEGLSDPIAITLPARDFKKPLAIATIEQRRALAFHPTSITRVARILNDLTQDADKYIDDRATYLGLRAAFWRLRTANHDEDLTGIYDLLWSVALRIEDGDLSLAESDMRRARDALAKALSSGAGQDEIAQLMAEMREAFKRYMDAVMARSGDNPDQAMMERFAPQDGQSIDRDTLEKMLGQIDDLARSGSREEAQRLLEQMQAIMENMQTPDRSAGMSPDEQAMASTVDELTDLMDRQRKLMDETFQAGPHGPNGENGAGGQNGEGGTGKSGAGKGATGQQGRSLKALKADQEALRDKLSDMLKALEEKGVKTPGQLGKAGEQMKNAESRLDDGRNDRASQSQGLALQNLREGTQGLINQLSESMAGKGGKPGQQGVSGGAKDPFGRSARQSGESEVTVPDEFDRQKARAIIEDLRRRASEIGRPQSEIDYLDRLLNRF
jgi:uncharacterized protein (TIGR02302 family)